MGPEQVAEKLGHQTKLGRARVPRVPISVPIFSSASQVAEKLANAWITWKSGLSGPRKPRQINARFSPCARLSSANCVFPQSAKDRNGAGSVATQHTAEILAGVPITNHRPEISQNLCSATRLLCSCTQAVRVAASIVFGSHLSHTRQRCKRPPKAKGDLR
jgi:hypothetical protein